jgi:hypothetical protein
MDSTKSALQAFSDQLIDYFRVIVDGPLRNCHAPHEAEKV